MTDWRLTEHPILEIPPAEEVPFYWQGSRLTARPGEMISSALFAAGIQTFGHHPKDHSPQGIFCANGQCAQCAVVANGVPVKACMTKVAENMIVEPLDGLPELPQWDEPPRMEPIGETETEALIVGGGPAGLSAALELGRRGVKTLLVDDKDRLGGKLVLQTHKFFGSIADCHAGTRGVDIGTRLANEVAELETVDIWPESTAQYVFSDKKIGVVSADGRYRLVKPQVVLNAAGAREKSLAFPGNTLPGVYGAGAFQTLVNRDLVKTSQRLFVVGGGNVGLIAAYHALQAGIDVVGLIEALPQVGGYMVHANKVARLGVPIQTGHTILSANGTDRVESVTVAKIDNKFQPIPGTEQTYDCDTVLIAVGLNPVNEFFIEAQQAGLKAFAAGDAALIAEASSAMFSGKIAGLEIAAELGAVAEAVPQEWRDKAELLRSHPGPDIAPDYDAMPEEGVFPVVHCTQTIPCNPCVSVCKQQAIDIPGDGFLEPPRLTDNECIGCLRCLNICPGLAITLVDYRDDPDNPTVSLPYEIYNHPLQPGDKVKLTDIKGRPLHEATVIKTKLNKASRKTQIIQVTAPKAVAKLAAGFVIQPESVTLARPEPLIGDMPDEAIVCRCERVTAGEIRALIRAGERDLNQIKAVTRAGMGACGYKTCESLILQLFRQEGVDLNEVTVNTTRPVFVESPLGVFAGARK